MRIVILLSIMLMITGCQPKNDLQLEVNLLTSDASNKMSRLITFDTNGDINKSVDIISGNLYEVEGSNQVYYLPSRNTNIINVVKENIVSELITTTQPFDILEINSRLFTISGVNLKYGILEEYANGDLVNSIELEGFLMAIEADEKVIYVRSDIIDIEKDTISSMLYSIDINTFKLVNEVEIENMGQCLTIDAIQDKVFIGNIFNESTLIASYEKDKLLYYDLVDVIDKENLWESIGFIEYKNNAYHIDRSGYITIIDTEASRIKDTFFIKGSILSAASSENIMNILVRDEYEKNLCKILYYDLDSRKIINEFEYISEKGVLPKAIFVK